MCVGARAAGGALIWQVDALQSGGLKRPAAGDVAHGVPAATEHEQRHVLRRKEL